MHIPYRKYADYQGVDIQQLRPKQSYQQLMTQRGYVTQQLIDEHGKIPESLLQQRPCPSCHHQVCQPELTKDGLQLVRCEQCSLVYVNPIFDEQVYREIYQADAYQEIVRNLCVDSHEYRLHRFGKERVDMMRQHLGIKDNVHYLDVGCGTGFVVEAAMRAGWHAMGLELNPDAVNFACQRGLTVLDAPLEDVALEPESLDAISLFDVLEHLTQPRQTLSHALTLLKPGGILYIYVPNYDSASRLLMGAQAHFIWPTHHLNYYTLATLEALLVDMELQMELLYTEGLDMADYAWYREMQGLQAQGEMAPIEDLMQFFINASGYGKNLRAIARKL